MSPSVCVCNRTAAPPRWPRCVRCAPILASYQKAQPPCARPQCRRGHADGLGVRALCATSLLGFGTGVYLEASNFNVLPNWSLVAPFGNGFRLQFHIHSLHGAFLSLFRFSAHPCNYATNYPPTARARRNARNDYRNAKARRCKATFPGMGKQRTLLPATPKPGGTREAIIETPRPEDARLPRAWGGPTALILQPSAKSIASLCEIGAPQIVN